MKFSTGSESASVYGFAGGYVAFGLFATLETTVTVSSEGNSESTSETQELDFEEFGLNRNDAGLLAGAGIRFGGLFFETRYTLGLSDLDTHQGSEAVMYNKGMVLSMGYFF